MIKEIFASLRKDILLELRQRYALNGIILYTASTVFICYMSIGLKSGKMQPATWNALFWIINLFIAVNAIAKSFIQERPARNFYYYYLLNPQALLLSKIIYNFLLQSLLSVLAACFYMLIMHNPVQNHLLFFLNIFLGGLAFSSALTLLSGIASKAANSGTLTAILGFPLLIPILLMLIKISKNAIDGLAWSSSYDELVVISSLNVMIITISYILFPYLWRS